MSTVSKKIMMGSGATASAYEIDQSAIFNSSSLVRTPSSTGNRKKFTISVWVKRTKLGQLEYVYGGQSVNETDLYFSDTDTLNFFGYQGGALTWGWGTTRVFRDVGAWYHIVAIFDSANSTQALRARLFVNGEEQPENGATSLAVTLNQDSMMNLAGTPQYIGRLFSASYPLYYSGYMAEFHFLDGAATVASNFGETNSDTGQWVPKKYSGGGYGTNGFYLKFVSGAIGTDSSGEGNNMTVTNLANSAVVTDTPTNNCMTLNPLDTGSSTLSQGNLTLVTSSHSDTSGTMRLPNTGKWYWEVTCTTVGGAYFGIYKTSYTQDSGSWVNGSHITLEASTGKKYSYPTTAATYMSGAVSNGDVVGVAVDCDNGKIFFADSNTWGDSGNPATGSNPAGTFTASDGWKPGFYGPGGASAINLSLNFGQKTFSYTPPSGFSALTASNLPEPAIAIPSANFNPHIYTGSNNTDAITGVGFQPDLVWVKQRDVAYNHQLHDAVRGAAAGLLMSDNNAGENSGYPIASFDSDGFTPASGNVTGLNTGSMVGWFWKANGAGSNDTSGDIDATVSANSTAGFSIVKYIANGTAGATVPHGLGVAPEMVFYKRYDASSSWFCWTTAIDGSDDYMVLNGTDAATAVTSAQSGGASFTSSFIRAVNYSNTNTIVAYCFASKDAYSSIGSYTGNGSSDGPMIVTGFRPVLILVKRTDATNNWVIYDVKRNTFNAIDKTIYTDTAAAEGTYSGGDILSNGFKVRYTGGMLNTDGGTYLYMAFAESPFKTANAR